VKLLGVIQAGGRNTRYGAHKALAPVGGESIIGRLRRALGEVAPDVVLVANEADVYAPIGLEMRPDARPGMGALGGILTALLWARERGCEGALVVAGDMPFVSPGLLGALVARAAGARAAGAGPDIVAPESTGRRGLEPLCAWYAVGCIPVVERALDAGRLRVLGIYEELRVERLPLAEVLQLGDPEVLFLNVNTPAERERAERIAAELEARA
jgi:molybdopterin-guanine dinucleotide biosynthesis protein A